MPIDRAMARPAGSTQTPSQLTPSRPVLRWFLAVASLLLIAGEGIYVASRAIPVYLNVADGDFDLEDIEYDTVTKFAVDVRIDQSKSLFTYCVVLLGVLWSMLLVKGDSPGIGGKDWQEIIIFIAANVAVAIHVALFVYYMWLVSALTAAAARARNAGDPPSIPDIFDPKVSLFSFLQQMSTAFVVIVIGILLISVHKLKGAPK